jgi:uncharacterized protein
MRVSSYVIGAPIPDQPFHVLMHGYTGAVDKVPRRLGEAIVAARGEELPPDIDLSDEMAAALAGRGYLTETEPEDERDTVLRIAAALHEADLSSHMTTFVFVPTYMCNLRCPYCFQSHQMHAGKDQFATLLTRERVDHAFGVIDQLARPGALASALGVIEPAPDEDAEHEHRHQEITLFGGEPLLGDTLPIVSYIAEKARPRGIAMSAITNGVELDKFVDLLEPGVLEELQITLDGPAQIHDQRRVGPGYRKTFGRIADNVDLALSRGVRVGLRINVNNENIDYLDELNETIEQRGWNEHRGFFANAATVHGAWLKPANRKMISPTDLIEKTIDLRESRGSKISSYEAVARRTLKNCLDSDNGYPFHGAVFCSAEAGMLIFDPLGEVYSCWEEIGRPRFRVGSYGAGGLEIDEDVLGQWLARFPGAIDECAACPYALIHKSGCAFEARRQSGTMFATACSSFQEYFPIVLGDAYAEVERRTLSDERPLPMAVVHA